jgi:hypothetical protein
MTTQNAGYENIQEGKPRVTSYDDNGVRTTTTTTRLGQDPTEKPRETVSVRTVQHPDATETITVTEKKLPPIRFTETVTREKLPKKGQVAPTNATVTDVSRSINVPPTITDVSTDPKSVSFKKKKETEIIFVLFLVYSYSS